MSVTSVLPVHLLASNPWIPWPIVVGVIGLIFVALPALIVVLMARFTKRLPIEEPEAEQFTNRDWLLMGITLIASGAIYSAGLGMWYHSLLTISMIGLGFRCVLCGPPPLDKRRRWWALTLLGSLALTQCITFLLMFMRRL